MVTSDNLPVCSRLSKLLGEPLSLLRIQRLRIHTQVLLRVCPFPPNHSVDDEEVNAGLPVAQIQRAVGEGHLRHRVLPPVVISRAYIPWDVQSGLVLHHWPLHLRDNLLVTASS